MMLGWEELTKRSLQGHDYGACSLFFSPLPPKQIPNTALEGTFVMDCCANSRELVLETVKACGTPAPGPGLRLGRRSIRLAAPPLGPSCWG